MSPFCGTRWFAALPLLFFVAGALYLSLRGAFDTGSMAAAGVTGMIVASFFARDKEDYWKAVLEGLQDRTGILLSTGAVLTGWRRSFEGRNGEPIEASFLNEVPAEAHRGAN